MTASSLPSALTDAIAGREHMATKSKSGLHRCDVCGARALPVVPLPPHVHRAEMTLIGDHEWETHARSSRHRGRVRALGRARACLVNTLEQHARAAASATTGGGAEDPGRAASSLGGE